MPASTDKDLNPALLVGAAAGLRSMTPLGVVAVRGDLGAGGLAKQLPLLALGELLADKLPFAPPRTMLPSLAGRAVVGGLLAGGRRGDAQTALAGAAAAVVAANGGQHTRKFVGRFTSRTVRVALVEDALAIGLAYLGTRPRRA